MINRKILLWLLVLVMFVSTLACVSSTYTNNRIVSPTRTDKQCKEAWDWWWETNVDLFGLTVDELVEFIKIAEFEPQDYGRTLQICFAEGW